MEQNLIDIFSLAKIDGIIMLYKITYIIFYLLKII